MGMSVRGVMCGMVIAMISFAGMGVCADEGFKPLFDGKTLTGWMPLDVSGEKVAPADSAFSVKDGILYCSGKGNDYWIVAPGTYKDFVLRLQYKLVKDSNSGVFIHVPKPGHPAFLGFEVQIMGDSGEKPGKHSTGAIYDVLPPTKNMAKPEGEWNQYEITCKGPLVTVILNGEKVIDTDFSTYTKPIGKFDFPYCDLPKEGWVGVQNHGGEIWFKNIEIKELK